MSAKLFSASLGGVPLKCQSTETGFEKGISKNEIPYTNGAETEDTGLQAATIGLRCYFLDDNYADLAKLKDVLKSLDVLDFVHPRAGLMRVRVERAVIRDNEQSSASEVDLNLVEHAVTQTLVRPWQDIQGEAEKNFKDSVEEQKLSLGDKLAALGAEGAALCESAIGSFGGLMTTVANPANSLASLVDYGTDLPGRFVREATLAVERYAIAYNTLRNSPATFMAALAGDLGGLAAAFAGFEAQANAAGAARLGLEAAGFFSSDDQLRQTNGTAETAPGFDVNGNRLTDSVPDTLNATEIEDMLVITNTAIQTALQGDRGNYALKRMAAALYTAAAELKKSAENVKPVRINEPTPIHIVCLRYGLPYAAAPRVLALNPQIKDPNRVSGEILMYV